jgi:hypothetical protein
VALTITTTPQLDAWLDGEAAVNGLDPATFVRMLLFRQMHGTGQQPAARSRARRDNPEIRGDVSTMDTRGHGPMPASTHANVDPGYDADGDTYEEATPSTRVRFTSATPLLRHLPTVPRIPTGTHRRSTSRHL